jgi:selT/selW/selH-like putative selenoprotein
MLNGRGLDAEAEPGTKGQFDVVRDGEVIFSKWKEGRFPEEAEVLTLLT